MRRSNPGGGQDRSVSIKDGVPNPQDRGEKMTEKSTYVILKELN